MQDKIRELKSEIAGYTVASQDELEAYRLKFISRKGVMGDLFAGLKDVPAEDKKAVGQALNELKNTAQDRFKELIESLENNAAGSGAQDHPDLTLPPVPDQLGSIHPLSKTQQRIVEIFEQIGFSVAEGPEIEDDFHNFSALNFPENHPAREMQDTFFIEKNPDMVLRTHTSSVQVRVMETTKPPLRKIMPGRVYRNEAISARAHCFFHQVEGIYIAENVSFVDLKQTLFHFAKEMFGSKSKVRFRPSYFPFTEVSAEMDVSCGLNEPGTCEICGGRKNVCKGTGWVEICGAGMIDPQVLENCGIDSEKYTGFAFGMGVERIAMLKYNIQDLRLFSENDVRFLRQFTSMG
ncbi:MAG: phenylalanine--tRNA ligase subunit alpha [Cyclobacteriaceae bacterium]